AACFHRIPICGLYWVFKWPRELARFVNSRLEAPLMRPDRTGLAVFIAFAVFLVLDRGLGMILLFWAASYAVPALCAGGAAGTAPGQPPFSCSFIPRRVNAERDALGLANFSNRELCADRTNSRSGSYEAVGARHLQGAH